MKVKAMSTNAAKVWFNSIFANNKLAGLADKSGMAATEFALILPILSMIFFGMLETSDAMMASRRVANAANSLVDLVGQETQITKDEVDDAVLGVKRMLEPTDSSSIAINIVSVIRDPDDPDSVIVHWSRDDRGGTPYRVGEAYTKLKDGANVHSGASLLVVEMKYTYVSGLTNKVIGNSFRFNKTVARWPRQSARVKLCERDPNNPKVMINCSA